MGSDMEVKDSIVLKVIEKFKDRSLMGLEKYGTTLDRNDLSLLDWINHAQEELMDGILYLEKIKSNEKDNEKSKKNNKLSYSNEFLLLLIDVLVAIFNLFLFTVNIFSNKLFCSLTYLQNALLHLLRKICLMGYMLAY